MSLSRHNTRTIANSRIGRPIAGAAVTVAVAVAVAVGVAVLLGGCSSSGPDTSPSAVAASNAELQAWAEDTLPLKSDDKSQGGGWGTLSKSDTASENFTGGVQLADVAAGTNLVHLACRHATSVSFTLDSNATSLETLTVTCAAPSAVAVVMSSKGLTVTASSPVFAKGDDATSVDWATMIESE